ncbi:MAG: DUF494 domain-containing protein [Candidatus Hydrogenedentes bacterium]|nr:DUF494 domain-containing protein [Candidatus Hydrogenedentota bacterium]
MKQLVTKLVDVILKRLEEQPDAVPTENGIRSWLTGQGYKKRDIDAAIKLVAPRFLSVSRENALSRVPVRTLSLLEEYKLLPEARDALARLDMYGLIDPYEREMILDRLNHFDGLVGLDELDYLLSWVVCGGRDVESQQTIFGVLEGDSQTLH